MSYIYSAGGTDVNGAMGPRRPSENRQLRRHLCDLKSREVLYGTVFACGIVSAHCIAETII